MTHFTRRQFLALGAAGAALAAVPASASAKKGADAVRTSRPIRKYGESMETFCAGCESHCMLTAYRQQGRVASVVPTGGGCPRGSETIEALYDGERLTTPLRRVGPRGSGKWEEISWDEAAELIAGKLKGDAGRAMVDLGRPDPLAASLFPLLGIGKVATSIATASWASKQARKALYGSEYAVADFAKASTVLLIGANPLDGGDDFGRTAAEIVNAKAQGAKIVLISARAGLTGSYADRWIPVKPGEEAAAAVTLAKTLFNMGLLGPVSLKELTGLTVEEVQEALAGAAAGRGLSTADAAWLAERFKKGAVAVRADGSGLSDAKTLEAAAALLNVFGRTDRARLQPQTGAEIKAAAPRERLTAGIMGQDPAGLYLAYRANPVYDAPGGEKLAKAFADERKIGLLVSFDTMLTETGLVSDLLLPASADLESWNVLAGGRPDGAAGIALQRPVQVWDNEPDFLRGPGTVLEKLFNGPMPGPAANCRQLGDLLSLVALKMGRQPEHTSAADAARAIAAKAGIAENACFAKADLPAAPLKADGAVLLENIKKPLAAKNAPAGTLKLVPVSFTELDRANPNSVIGREIRHDSEIYLNAATAAKLGLKKGGVARVNMGGGEFTAHVFPVQTLHPEAVAFPFGFGHRASGQVASLRPVEEVTPQVSHDRKGFLKHAAKSPFGAVPAEKQIWWREHGPGTSLTAKAEPGRDGDGAPLWRELAVSVGKA